MTKPATLPLISPNRLGKVYDVTAQAAWPETITDYGMAHPKRFNGDFIELFERAYKGDIPNPDACEETQRITGEGLNGVSISAVSERKRSSPGMPWDIQINQRLHIQSNERANGDSLIHGVTFDVSKTIKPYTPDLSSASIILWARRPEYIPPMSSFGDLLGTAVHLEDIQEYTAHANIQVRTKQQRRAFGGAVALLGMIADLRTA